MANSNYLSVNEFAKLSRITCPALRYYNQIGLLSPVLRGENNYRYYHTGQIAGINSIRTFQKLGMTLDEIKNLTGDRTLEFTKDLFAQQVEKIDTKIEEWVSAKKLLFTLQKSINSVIDIDEEAITIKPMPAEAIILGDLNDYSNGRTDYDALLSFYYDMGIKYEHLDMNYPVWGLFSEERIKRGDWVCPDRYYFYNPEGHDRKPSALYAIGYKRGGYGQCDELYNRLIEYIDKKGFEICGDAYEEYPLNEICINDENNYLIRVMIVVQKKTNRKSINVPV